MIYQYNEIEEFKGKNLQRGNAGDMGYDVRAGEPGKIYPGTSSEFIYTGLHINMPPWIGATMKTRSGHTKANLLVDGVIDSGFQGAISIKIHNLNNHDPFRYKKGDRIAQVLFHICPEGFFNALASTLGVYSHSFGRFEITESDNMDDWPETARGVKGFGSSGIS